MTLSEQNYFVWDTATQSTKRQDMLKMSLAMSMRVARILCDLYAA